MKKVGCVRPLHVLVVEDSATDAELMIGETKKGGFDVTWLRAENPENMKTTLDAESWDLVIADHRMLHFDGLAALRVMQPRKIDKPLTTISGMIDEDTAVTAMEAGAHYCFAKNNLSRLTLAVDRDFCEASILREQIQFNRQIIEGAQEGIVVYGRDLKYRVWNPYMEKMTDMPARKVFGRHPLEVFPFLKSVGLIKTLLKARAGEDAGTIEFPFYIANTGKRGWSSNTSGALRNSKGEIIGVMATVRDITRQKQEEESHRALSRRMHSAADIERQRVARELHDSGAQQLAAALMNLGRLEKSVARAGAKNARILRETVELLERCSQDMRTLSYRLHPPLLDELGLESALRVYIEGFSKRSNIEVSIKFSSNSCRLPQNIEMVLFRFVQEGLGNMHRHSGSRTAQVKLLRERGQVTIEVSDQGRGIPIETLRDIKNGILTKGVGIAAMRGRLLEVQGRIEFDSNEAGTVARAIVPITCNEQNKRRHTKPASE